MSRNLLSVLLSFLAVNMLVAQKVTEVGFSQEGQNIIIRYNLTGVKYYQAVNISVYVSVDGGKAYNGPLTKVEGDAGLNITPGTNKKIVWDVFEEIPDFGGQVSFEVRAVVNEEKIKRNIYAGYKGSYLAPAGMVVGITGKTGFYLSARTDLFYLKNINTNYYSSYGVIIQDYKEPGYYTFTSNYRTQRFSITGGITFMLTRNLSFYAGGGYSVNDVLWEIAQFDYNDVNTGKKWVKNEEISYSFPEAETGLWVKIKPFFVSAGVSVCGDKWIDGTLSAGIIF